MEKKLWSNAEIVELGVEKTTEQNNGDGPYPPKYECPICHVKFYNENGLKSHLSGCGKHNLS